MILLGLVGIVRYKRPKYRDGVGFGLEANFYLSFYFLLIMGMIFLYSELADFF